MDPLQRKRGAAVLMHAYRRKISEYILRTIIYSQQDIFRYSQKSARPLSGPICCPSMHEICSSVSVANSLCVNCAQWQRPPEVKSEL